MCEVQVSFWSKSKPRSFAFWRVEISKPWRNSGWMEGIGILVSKMTRYVLREEKRESFSEAHEEMELSVCCSSLWALWGLAERKVRLKSSAKSLCVRGKFTHLVVSLIALRKSKMLNTSPWGTPFCIGTGEDVVFCIRTDSFLSLSLRKLWSMYGRFPRRPKSWSSRTI